PPRRDDDTGDERGCVGRMALRCRVHACVFVGVTVGFLQIDDAPRLIRLSRRPPSPAHTYRDGRRPSRVACTPWDARSIIASQSVDYERLLTDNLPLVDG